ncbi:hypothetical protein HK105_207570 [Polyrhizophydium stewartii]|uniref:Major facilitator superfamily (MFS) profile domain-containing protein n=1 Tax=Polyrhizophydium stewartii TaxID=2732419 RepID=A0ABR4N089_9FUNG
MLISRIAAAAMGLADTRWTVLALSSCLLFGNYYAYDLPAALNRPLQAFMASADSEFAVQLGLMYSAYSLPNVVLPLVGGWLADRLGSWRLMLACAALVCAGQLCFAAGVSARSFALMQLGRVVFGVGGETLSVCQSAITASWFQGREMALALGINLSIARLGSVFNDVASPYVALHASIPAAMWLGAVTCTCSFLCAASLAYLEALMPANFRSSRAQILHPHALAHAEAGSRVLQEGIRKRTPQASAELQQSLLELSPLPRTDSASSHDDSLADEEADWYRDDVTRAKQTDQRTLLQQLPFRFWLICLSMCLLYATVIPFNSIHAAFLQSKWYKDNPQQASQVMGIPDTISAILVPFVGSFVDRVGHRVKVLLACSLIMAGVHWYFALATPMSPSPIYALIPLGLAYSMLLTFWPCIALVVDENAMATAFGVATALLNAALTVFPMVTAALVRADATFVLAETFFVGCSAAGGAAACALLFVALTTGVPRASLRIASSFATGSRMHHVHVQQQLAGLDIVNAVANINIDAHGRIISMGHNLVPPSTLHALGVGAAPPPPQQHRMRDQTPLLVQGDAVAQAAIGAAAASGSGAAAQSMPRELDRIALSPLDAVLAASAYLGLDADAAHMAQSLAPQRDDDDGHAFYVVQGAPRAIKDVPVKLKFVQTDGGRALAPVWDLVMDIDTNWFHIQVDARTGQVMALIDWVSGATYNVYPLGVNDPDSGKRSVVVNPEHPVASPKGWHSKFAKGKTAGEYNVTSGNNVFAQDNPDGGSSWRNNYRPSGGADLVFDFPANLTRQPSTYIDAAITNLFYYNNIMHDLFYVYGFDEVAGNFQMDNFGKGGKGNDAVIANAQDGSGYNNANFATPPDGQQGRMRMYVWTVTKPNRDGDLEGGIIIHEYAHGISTRLTGGPSNSGCLGWGESGGMGEGWGDFFATILRMTPNSTAAEDFGMGNYASGSKRGIRKYAYSTSLETNPSTYGFVQKPDYWEVHAKGEVWAEILFEYYWALVEKHGFEPDWFNIDTSSGSLKGLAGNKLALQLVVDGLKLQPCYPSFVDARDAILLADQTGTNGENQCTIWAAFAKRGLGLNAVSGGEESFDVPEECAPPKDPKKPKEPKEPKDPMPEPQPEPEPEPQPEPTPEPPKEPKKPKHPKEPKKPKKPPHKKPGETHKPLRPVNDDGVIWF